MVKKAKKNETARKPRVEALAQAHLLGVTGGDPPPTKIRETLVAN